MIGRGDRQRPATVRVGRPRARKKREQLEFLARHRLAVQALATVWSGAVAVTIGGVSGRKIGSARSGACAGCGERHHKQDRGDGREDVGQHGNSRYCCLFSHFELTHTIMRRKLLMRQVSHWSGDDAEREKPMLWESRLSRIMVLLFGLAGSWAAATDAQAQPSASDARAAALQDNVVKITATFGEGAPKSGFGIIVGEQGRYLVVVTADHVVRGEDPGAEDKKPTITFFRAQGSQVQGKLETVRMPPGGGDLAVILVPRPGLRDGCEGGDRP